jgi:hypothetical protein
MRKQLHTVTVANELQGASLFFRPPVGQPTSPTVPDIAQAPRTERTADPARTLRTGGTPRTPSPAPRRPTRRHPFDIYDDQLAALRRLALADRMDGGPGSMSQMVREAIDHFLAEAEQTGI